LSLLVVFLVASVVVAVAFLMILLADPGWLSRRVR
jgi:VIT1/CCC1 family predicted Fe2+/Mn2+ transporter